MNAIFTELRANLKEAERKLHNAKLDLLGSELNCAHVWSVTDASESIPGYTVPGTMGVDHRRSFFVPASTITKWKRTCTNCGREEITQKSKILFTQVTEQPIF